MTGATRRGRTARAVATLALTGGLVLAGTLPAAATGIPPATNDSDDGLPIGVTVPESTEPPSHGATTVDDAQLWWGLSREASGGAFAGGCNFLSAGLAGDSGGARVWGAVDGLYSAREGDVEIVKATAAGEWQRASFETKCLDAAGNAVTAASLSSSTDSQVVFSGGAGRIGDDGVDLRWTGSFTVAFYGGMTYWSASDPVLTVDASGTGRLTATLSGYGTSIEDLSTWEPIPGRTVVLAELRDVELGEGGFQVLPEYVGVEAAGAGQVPRTEANAPYWGAFPATFLGFQKLTGQTGYWLTSGGQRDPAKPATPITVNADARAPAIVPTTGGGAPSGGGATEIPRNDAVFAPRGPTTSAPPAVAATPQGTAQAASTVQRANAPLVPGASDVLTPLVLPLGGTLLAMLVSVLASLHLAGRLRFPWSRA
ncbi:hypothetical protein ELQ90_10515 [Labedella phragmitis]|uniref:Htaa domain-containing protein n=1 Tax=Labedella phragmitis TaxID=2498849 RepID=A0A444PR65_9MICO|nr:hypothetical protein [Labedella phragmitis]RWZ49788.1 hypothetical protein ELQ90_10515 [Labedella phragmitis]